MNLNYFKKFRLNISKNLLLFALLLFTISACAQPEKDKLLTENTAEKLLDSFVALHPDTVAYPTEAKSYKWNYEQGLILEAFYRLWKERGIERYYDYLKKNIDYYIEDDGTIKTYKMEDFNIDNISSGKHLLYLYQETNEEKYKKAADTLRRQLSLHPRTSEGGFWHKKIYPSQMWLDGLYMAQPFYVQYANLFEDEKIYDDIANQFLLVRENLRDEDTGLYYHGWDESREQKWADPETGRSPNYWGRAMGWFMMGIVDVLDHFPKDHPNRTDIINILQDLSKSVLKYRDEESKLWYQVVDAGDKEGNYLEASASAMFIYAFAKGVNDGYLNEKYFTEAKKSFKSLVQHLVTFDDEGNVLLNDVASVAGLGGNPYRDGSFEYYISEPKRTNDFKGYGPFMLAAIELEKNK